MNLQNATDLSSACKAMGMDTLELLEFVDGFRYFPRSHRHCRETWRGRNLKEHGYYGFFETGKVFNMDIVDKYLESHDISQFELLNNLDKLADIVDDWKAECEEAEWQERFCG